MTLPQMLALKIVLRTNSNSEPVRRHVGRSYSKGQDILLLFLSGAAPNNTHLSQRCDRTYDARADGEFFSILACPGQPDHWQALPRWHDWALRSSRDEDHQHLDSDGELGHQWLAWLHSQSV